jgi:hypothetical protein
MAKKKRVGRRANKGAPVVKRPKEKKSTGTTDFERRLEAEQISMYELARRTGYSYQHVWNAAKGRTAGSKKFWDDVDAAIDAWKKEQRAKARKP